MKNTILLITFCSAAFFAQAQGYDTAFGLRLGTEWGLTLKQRLAQRITAEGILQYSNRYKQTTITALGAKHFPLLVRNFNIYGGAGLHKGFVNIDGDDAPKDPFGLTFIGGAEISVGRINVSWDIKPSINVTGGEKTIYTHTGVSVRYIIDKRPLIEKKSEKEKERAKRQRQKRKAKRKKKRAKKKGVGEKGIKKKISIPKIG